MYDIVNYFKNKGMVNPLRSIELIKTAIKFNKLNLNDIIVFTEAATGEFIYTPIIAAMGGAKKVYAIASDSKYGTKEIVKKDTMLFAELCGVKESVDVVFNKNSISEADIVTNLGFVRPINKELINKMKKECVIPYMCESWEVRNGDVDISYCKHKGIKVMGTNENYPGLNVFSFSGALALKMLFDAGIEVFKSKIIIVSNDDFGIVIYENISKITCDVILLKSLDSNNVKLLKDADALIIADYTSKNCFVGSDNCLLQGERLKKLSNQITVIQFAGLVDVDNLKRNNINFYPNYQVGSFRMGKTLAYLGPKPIIDLHCAGLKVGELTYRGNFEENLSETLYQYI